MKDIRADVTLSIILITLACQVAAQSSTSVLGTADVYRQPSVFVENRGQWDGDFVYETRVGAMTVFVQRSGWTFTLVEGKESGSADELDSPPRPKRPRHEVARGVAVRMKFAGTAGAQNLVPGARSPGVHHYFLGSDPSRWRTDVPLYKTVRLARVWPGVDVDARIEHRHFEYDVLVSPGADLEQVIIDVEGAEELRLEADGTLVIETALGPVRQPPPKTWQVTAQGERETVACDYVILDEARFAFSAPTWNRGRSLVIDPGLLYLGLQSFVWVTMAEAG
jgi:hypothetical protein